MTLRSALVLAGVAATTSVLACSSNSPEVQEGGSGAAGIGGGASGAAGSASGASGASGSGAGKGGSAGQSSGSGGVPSGGESGSGAGGFGGTIPPPNGGGDAPNLRVVPWNGRRAAVTLTFDDADPSHYDLAAPVLDERGVKATFFVVSNTIESIGQGARDGFARLSGAGHELANHTRTHAGSSQGDASEVSDCDAYLRNRFGVEPSTFAYPNVDITATYKNAAAALYVASRGGGDGAHVAWNGNPDWHNLPSYFIADPANDQGYLYHPDQATAALDATLEAGAWRILTIHGVGPNGFWANTSVANLTLVVEHLSGKDFWVDTFARVAGYLRAARALEGATVESNAAGLDWTWTVPPGFPGDVRLRVLIDGGTLTQNGQTLVWNGTGGYYPVDPRTGSLRWSR
jgi:peptidoglycan/xylan/chitin deacetylase (PgdA/CDA1 family)